MRVAATVMICLLMGRMALAQPATTASIDEIEADFAAQKYQDVLRKSSIALQARPALSAPDRAAVLELKAESHLRLKQYTPAAEAYAAAAREVSADSLAAAKYQATARLLRSLSAGGQYQPRTGGGISGGTSMDRPSRPAALNVVERQDRELALLALYDDEHKTVEAVIERLGPRPTLQALQNAVSRVEELRTLELAATGTESGSKLMLDPIKERVAVLLNAPLAQLADKIEHLERLASRDRTISQTVTPNGVRQEISQKVGLTAAERVELQRVARDLNTILTTTQELSARLGVTLDASGTTRRRSSDPPTLDSVYSDAQEQLELTAELLGANYVSTPVNATRGRSTRSTPAGP